MQHLNVLLCKERWPHIRSGYWKWRTRCSNLDTPNLIVRVHKYRDELQFLAPYCYYQRETNPGLADSMGESSKANYEPPPSNNGVEESKQPPPPRKRSRCNLEEEEALEIWENRITACVEAIEQQLQGHAETQRVSSLRLFSRA